MKKITPQTICLFIAVVSVTALVSALISQYVFGLHPCHLCMYQRWPFVVTITLGLIGMATRLEKPVIALSGITFLINAGIAFYHSGVERKWWAGLEGCTTPDMSGSIQDLMKRIEETAVTRCDEIAFELFGLSMANYNVLLCLGCAAICFAFIACNRKI